VRRKRKNNFIAGAAAALIGAASEESRFSGEKVWAEKTLVSRKKSVVGSIGKRVTIVNGALR
jgi:hypothetical protein